jgi:hypothetical protein
VYRETKDLDYNYFPETEDEEKKEPEKEKEKTPPSPGEILDDPKDAGNLIHAVSHNNTLFNLLTDWRSGPNSHLIPKRWWVRSSQSTNICVHEHVCLYWISVFL